MERSSRHRVWELLWVVGAIALLYVVISSRGSIRLFPADSAEVAPTLEVRSVAGEGRRLSDLQGKVVLVNLWASWCGPCRREIPRLNRLAETFKGEGLEVWGLNAESLEGEALRRVADELGVEYDVYQPAAGLDGPFQGEGVIPHSWLIDRAGRIRASHAGLPSEASLRKVTRQLLAER